MANKKTLFITLSFLILLLGACGRSGEAAMSEQAPGVSADRASTFSAAASGDFEVAAEAEDAAFGSSQFSGSNATSDLPQAQTRERLIIRTGQLSIVVEDTEASLAEITSLVEASGGWVVNSNLFQYSGDAKTGNITVRIPAEGFSSAINAVKALALEVTSESTSGQDVTDEFVDLSSRLSNLEATASRVRNFLDEARNVDDALAVNQELSRLEGEIEVIKGRMQYLSQSAAFSTLTISLTPDILSQPIEVGGWRPRGIALEAVRALIDTLQGLAGILIWFAIYLLPLIILLGVPTWLFVRFLVRQRRRRRAAAATE
jgi:hypothetical protein